MRVLVFHGYLLAGTGSNVYTANLAAALVRLGHEVHLLAQERAADALPFVDAVGDWDGGELALRTLREPVRCTVYRPALAGVLPLYVADRYEGIDARPFPDLTDVEVAAYVERNVRAVRDVAARVRPDVALANHAVMGPLVLARALDGVPYAVKIHGSAIEYTVRPHPGRFLAAAREGIAAARGILVGSRHTAQRLWDTLGDASLAARTRLGPPGVDVDRFAPRDPAAARAGLAALAQRLEERAEAAEAGGLDATTQVQTSSFALDDRTAARALARLVAGLGASETAGAADAAGARGDAAGARGDAAGARGDAPGARGDAPGARGDAPGASGDAAAGRGHAAGARGRAAGAPGDAAAARGRAAGAPGDRLVAFVGKLIVSKGVDLLVAAWPLVLASEPRARLVVVGFGAYRGGVERLIAALAAGDLDAAAALAAEGRGAEGGPPGEGGRLLGAFLTGLDGAERAGYLEAARDLRERIVLTGRLEHEELADLLPACEAQVVPSTFPEAFGMVAAEAAACGALPICADHSGLAEVAGALADAVPPAARDWLAFDVEADPVRAIAQRIVAWLAAPGPLRAQTRAALVATARERWSWEGVARGVLAAARGELDALPEPAGPAPGLAG